MVGEWREYCVGEIADIVGGSTPSTGDPSNFEGYIPWNTPNDLSGPHKRYESRGERNLSRKGLEGATPGRRGAGGAGLGRDARPYKRGGSRRLPSRHWTRCGSTRGGLVGSGHLLGTRDGRRDSARALTRSGRPWRRCSVSAMPPRHRGLHKLLDTTLVLQVSGCSGWVEG
jgi:hypothetical protein